MSRFDELFSKQQTRQAALGTGKNHPAKGGGWDVARYQKRVSPDAEDLQRILELPIVPELTKAEIEEFSYNHLLAGAFDRGSRFLWPQAASLSDFMKFFCGFYPIGVGFGKTGIGLYAAELAYRAGIERILLLVPPQVYSQLIQQDIPFWRKMVHLSVPIHRLGGQPAATRRNIARAGRKGLYIMPYSLLSTSDTMELLAGIDAQLVIGDEVHNLKNRRAARTRRLVGWRDEREALTGEQVKLVAMSGTITNKSIDDYHHLITWALRDRSPLPKARTTAMAWGSLVDSGSEYVNEHQAGPLRPLVRWAHDNFEDKRPFKDTISDFRKAFKLRLMSAPGVVCTGDAEIGTSLTLEVEPTYREPGQELKELMVQVQEEYITPNGDEIQHAFHTYKWMSELCTGFYNLLLWPDEESLLKRFGDKDKAKAALAFGKEYHGAHQAWSKQVRLFCEEAPPGLDTPMTVAKLINQQHRDAECPPTPEEKQLSLFPAQSIRFAPELTEPYWEMRAIESESLDEFGILVERIGKVCRVDDFKVRSAITWAKARQDEGSGCLLWYWHNAIGDWLVDLAREQDLDFLYARSGENEGIINHDNAGKVVIASMGAHGTGKNLQHFHEQLFVQWPRHAQLAEQTLGRCHRTGQQKDELIARRFDAHPFDALNFAACLNDAVYIHQSTGQRQKLVFARYNPLPPVFSPEFLREQGADPKILTTEQRQMMEELFGAEWVDKI